MKLLKQTFSWCWPVIGCWLCSILLLVVMLFLYGLPLDLIIFYSLCSGSLILVYVIRRYFLLKRMNERLLVDDFQSFFYPGKVSSLVEKLNEQQEKMQNMDLEQRRSRTDLEDYFSMWAHQVKLPAASMRLLLEAENPSRSEMKEQVKRIEQYVSAAMAYIRLTASTTDYQFHDQILDDIVREQIRNFAVEFIHRKITLDFRESGLMVSTDRKWSGFVIEQLLSNALKYSPDGGKITVYTEGNWLVIEDEGPGISAADLPRLFDKEFTGARGRENISESSGIGLYLCDQITKKMNHRLKIESEEGKGTRAMIEFPQPKEFGD